MRRLDYSSVILCAGFVVLFFSSGSRFAFGLVLKPMTEDLGWTRSSLSLAATMFFIVSALSMPLLGRLVDRYSLRVVMAATTLLTAVGIGLMGSVSYRWQVFALYGLVFAVGNAGTSVAIIGVMISRWFARRRGIANSAAISGNAAGQLVIITLLASFLASIGWRGAYLALGAANLVVAPLMLAVVRSRPSVEPSVVRSRPSVEPSQDADVAATSSDAAPRAESGAPAALASIARSRQLWLLVTVYAVCGFQDFFVATHIVAFADDQGVRPLLAGNMLAIMGLMGLVGVLCSGLLADAYGAARPTALCFLMRIGVFAFIIYFQGTLGILAFALLYGFTFLVTAPLVIVFVGNIFGTARLGAISGIINMAHQVFGGLGAFVGALFFDAWGSYDGAFALTLGLAFVGLAATLMLRERTV